jgi:hypothetical protein
MTKKTLVAIAVIIALLFTAVTPSRARADNTAVIVIASLAAFVAFIVVGTLLTTNRQTPLFLQEMPPQDMDPAASTRRDAVHFGTNCRPSATAGQPLVCW